MYVSVVTNLYSCSVIFTGMPHHYTECLSLPVTVLAKSFRFQFFSLWKQSVLHSKSVCFQQHTSSNYTLLSLTYWKWLLSVSETNHRWHSRDYSSICFHSVNMSHLSQTNFWVSVWLWLFSCFIKHGYAYAIIPLCAILCCPAYTFLLYTSLQ